MNKPTDSILTPEDIKTLLDEYATLICQSNPIKEWNWTELINHIAKAQGRKTREATLKEVAANRPKIICLCGSTQFTYEMLIKQWELTKQGNIVLSWCALPDDYYKDMDDKAHIGDKEGVKKIVDEIHKRKIDLSDEVIIIRAGRATNGMTYIGESTYSEMSYSFEKHKPVSFEPPDQSLSDNWDYTSWRKFIGKPLKEIPGKLPATLTGKQEEK